MLIGAFGFVVACILGWITVGWSCAEVVYAPNDEKKRIPTSLYVFAVILWPVVLLIEVIEWIWDGDEA